MLANICIKKQECRVGRLTDVVDIFVSEDK